LQQAFAAGREPNASRIDAQSAQRAGGNSRSDPRAPMSAFCMSTTRMAVFFGS